MSVFSKDKVINAFTGLGLFLANADDNLKQLVKTAINLNGWFTQDAVNEALHSLSNMLNKHDLTKWLEGYDPVKEPKKIGLILAGNIPLVGFHDVLSVLASGHIAQIKLSSQDNKLLPYILNKLVEIEPLFKERIMYTERLQDFDAIIATGSNNSSRYFDYYFSKVPNIIRKNRNSVAVLKGNESADDLKKLGADVFSYFGLGCRNVSKLYVPANYDFTFFFESIEEFNYLINHNKYNNNYNFNKSVYLINKYKHLDNGFLLVKEDDALSSPLAVLFFNYYDNEHQLQEKLTLINEQIQCVVTTMDLNIENQVVTFGQSQQPKLWDYADGVNTLDFLHRLT